MKILNESTRFTSSRVLVVSYILVIMLGTVLLMMPMSTTNGITFTDALFTSTSAVCVTGLIVKDTPVDFTDIGQFIILVLIQVGGLGYMAFSTLFALLIGKRIGISERILLKESLNVSSIEGIIGLLKRILIFVLMAEAIGALVLWFFFLRYFNPGDALVYGIFHSISAFNNAGFSLFRDNLMKFVADPGINIAIMSLIVVGGIGFIVVLEVAEYFRHKYDARRLHFHSRLALLVTGLLIVIGTAVFYLSENTYFLKSPEGGATADFMVSLFSSVSARTAGFNTIDFSLLQPATLFMIMILMLIGASPGSTGGGIKTTTFSIVFMHIYSFLRGREDVNIFKRRIPQGLVTKSMVIFTLAILYINLMTLIVVNMEHTPFEPTAFEVVSAFGTVGLSVGDGGVRSLSANFGDLSKYLITITMLIGRVGPLTLFASFLEGRQRRYRYPESGVLIG